MLLVLLQVLSTVLKASQISGTAPFIQAAAKGLAPIPKACTFHQTIVRNQYLSGRSRLQQNFRKEASLCPARPQTAMTISKLTLTEK